MILSYCAWVLLQFLSNFWRIEFNICGDWVEWVGDWVKWVRCERYPYEKIPLFIVLFFTYWTCGSSPICSIKHTLRVGF